MPFHALFLTILFTLFFLLVYLCRFSYHVRKLLLLTGYSPCDESLWYGVLIPSNDYQYTSMATTDQQAFIFFCYLDLQKLLVLTLDIVSELSAKS
jgi:hypothetical protein